MVNEYVWSLYLKSGGHEIAAKFQNSLVPEIPPDYAKFIHDFVKKYAVEKISTGTYEKILEYIKDSDEIGDEPLFQENYIQGTASCDEINELIDEWTEDFFADWLSELGTGKKVFENFSNNIESISTELSIYYPGIFVPYYYYANYNLLSIIADTFGSELPDIPKKADYKGRFWHYANLCKAFYKFRRDNGLDYYEFLAFLYDFAPKYIGGKQSYIIENLSTPKSAFFVGGGGNDPDANAENDPDSIFFWQCNPSTRAGDLIVMYLLSPISSISSIWRAKSVGFIDPFFVHYCCTYLGDPVKVDRFSINNIRTDPILGKMPIVNKNMQGINGLELRPSEYNHIVEVTCANAPRLEYVLPDDGGSYENEKAVEENLIKPLIKRLGYKENEYVQQMYIEIGNHNHALIPDFVLHPKSANGHYSGYAIIEAKRSILSDKQLKDVKSQARSYAKLLGTRYSVIASQERIWVMSQKDDYSACVFEESWDALADANTFYRLDHLIGNR